MSTPASRPLHPGRHVREKVLPSEMTVTEAARRLGVGRPALSNFLNGRAALSQQMARRLERAFGADAAALLDLQARYDAVATARGRQPVAGPSFAPSVTTIKAGQIADWADHLEARQHLAVLLRKLIHGTGTAFSRVDFPGHDSAERPDWDGWIATTAPTAWIPDGESGWEFGCSNNPVKKANADFDARLGIPDVQKKRLTFVFVTPREWPGKKKWAADRRSLRLWKDVRAYDADDLEQWIEQCVPVQVWFAEQLGLPVTGLVSLDEYWRRWAEATDPPLPRKLFQTPVERFSTTFRAWLEDSGGRRFTVSADSPAEAVALAACLMDHVGDDHELTHRGVVFETPEALQRLAASTPGAFVAIAARFEVNEPLPVLARTVHSVVPLPRNAVWSKEHEPDITLDPMSNSEFYSALSTINLTHDHIVRLARDSGRSPTVLRRRLSALPEVSEPPWAKSAETKLLGPLSLIGAWNAASEGDRQAISRLASVDHEDVEAWVRALTFDDPPVWSVGDYRGVVSRLDSFFATVSFWTPDLVRRFFEVAADVLAERDPALDLSEEDQHLAPVLGNVRIHSDALRQGLREGLVVLAVHWPRYLDRQLAVNMYGNVESVVANLLKPLDLDCLRSLEADLPDLAEAAPDAFLDAVAADLDSGDSAVMALMRPAGSNLRTGNSPRAGFLWALERLAWEPERFRRVVEILARLGEVAIDDNRANSPKSSLAVLFHAHLPQTMAPLSDRIDALRALVPDWPEVAWSVALSAESHQQIGFLMPSQRPMWRGDPSAHLNPASTEERRRFLRAARSLCLDWQQHDHRTLGDLVDNVANWDKEERDRVFQLIEDWRATHPAELELAALCERVRAARRTLRAVQPSLFSALTGLLKRISPQDPIASSRWLFISEWEPVHEYCDELEDDDFDAAERAIEVRRLAALRRIYEDDGFRGIERLLDATGAHRVVGRLLPDVLQTSDEKRIFVLKCLDGAMLGQADSCETRLGSFLWKHESAVILSLWNDVVQLRSLQAQQHFLKCLPYKQAVRLLNETAEDIRSAYWRDFEPNQFYSSAEKNELIDRLLEVKRPHAAFNVVTANWADIESSRLIRLLDAVCGAEASVEALRVVKRGAFLAFKSLPQRSDIPDAEKARLELSFFEWLRHTPYPMHRLAHRMAASPDLFVGAIARCYPRSDGVVDSLQPASGDDEQGRGSWSAAFQLLEWFGRLPGADDEGSVALEPLKAWVGEARSALRRLGRVEIGDQRIGRLLARAAPDASGRWPRRDICAVLENIGTEDLRIGFVAGALERRGVWTRGMEEGGDQERDLAARYRAWAGSVRGKFPFVAKALREIGKHYDGQAADMDTRGELVRRGVE